MPRRLWCDTAPLSIIYTHTDTHRQTHTRSEDCGAFRQRPSRLCLRPLPVVLARPAPLGFVGNVFLVLPPRVHMRLCSVSPSSSSSPRSIFKTYNNKTCCEDVQKKRWWSGFLGAVKAEPRFQGWHVTELPPEAPSPLWTQRTVTMKNQHKCVRLKRLDVLGLRWGIEMEI